MDPLFLPFIPVHLSHVAHLVHLSNCRLNQVGKGWLSSAGNDWQPEEGWGQFEKNLSSSHNHTVRKPRIVFNHKFLGSQKKKYNWEPFCHVLPLRESNNSSYLFSREVSLQRSRLLPPVRDAASIVSSAEFTALAQPSSAPGLLLPQEVKNLS